MTIIFITKGMNDWMLATAITFGSEEWNDDDFVDGFWKSVFYI